MAQTFHTLEVYEPYEYEGQNPLSATGVGVLRGPSGAYFLLSLVKPLQVNGDDVHQLVIQCRYCEDHINRTTESECTVNIACVHPNISLKEGSDVSFGDISHWGVGKITPIHLHN